MSFWTQNMGSGSIVGGGSTTPGRSPIIQIPLSQFSTALSSPYSAPSYPTKGSTPMMETESIRSGHSDRSKRGNAVRSPGSGTGHHHRSRRSHSHKSGGGRCERTATGSRKGGGGGDARDGDEVIEVQILPQDDNWGECIYNVIFKLLSCYSYPKGGSIIFIFMGTA